MGVEPTVVRAPILPADCFVEIVRHAEAGYPNEVCGMVVGRAPERLRALRVRNIADHEPQADPDGRLRRARTAYLMDPLEQLGILRELELSGEDVIGFYHSHPDHPASFSAMDRQHALLNDKPIWPGASYLVISVVQGCARSAAWFTWEPTHCDFAREPVRMAGGSWGNHE